MTAAPPLDRIRSALRAVDGDEQAVAVGWATVDLDRAVAALAGALGLDPDSFAVVADSVVLGARCRAAAGVLPGSLTLAVLEPADEGRLAASLARDDEGPAVVWALATGQNEATAPTGTPGPFGPERLASADRRARPIVLVLDARTGTIPA